MRDVRAMAMCAVILFAKAPLAGRVKTRLARDIGVIAAAFWYRRTLAATLTTIGRARLDAQISASPSAAAFRNSFHARSAAVSDQPAGDLGRRMAGAAKRARGPSIIVGADVPELSASILAAARDAVRRCDLVFGPAGDGGYYLLGLKSPAHAFRLYAGVRWSGPHALGDTLRNAPKHWRVAFLPMLHDVDHGRDVYAGMRSTRQAASISRAARVVREGIERSPPSIRTTPTEGGSVRKYQI